VRKKSKGTAGPATALAAANMNNDAPETIDTNTLETTTGGRRHGHHGGHHGGHHHHSGDGYWAAVRAAAYASAFAGHSHGWGQQPVVINYY
jgi:hypothetical protein